MSGSDPRSYGHFCMLAKALERVGDRWALLVVRDLMSGPKRFTDLMDRMAGITLYVDHLACERRDNLAAADAAEGTDRCRSGCAAGFERRDRRGAARLRQGADRHGARCQSLEKLAARWLLRPCVCRVVVSVPSRLIFIFIFHLCPLGAHERRLGV